MANLLPFRRTSLLIREIDEFLDRVSEAAMVFEQTFEHYLEEGPGEWLAEKLGQVGEIEDRADELRRNIANMMYSEMLMPDTRGDVLSLLRLVDTVLDDSAHLVGALYIERPEVGPEYLAEVRAMIVEVTKAVQSMLHGARVYFKEPNAVRDHVHKINFHEKEATRIGLRVSRAIFASDRPLELKRHARAWLVDVRTLASSASDIGDELAIFAAKRSI
jgi:predicted phosphate transport protein (TIGR00153 family)